MSCTIVIATRNRRAILETTLARLRALPEAPPIIVVDNGSDDGTAEALAAAYPEIRLVALAHNFGAAARTVGARLANTRYVAFSDDDCWWAPNALARAGAILDKFPGIALVNARIHVRDDAHVDETSVAMAASPLRLRCASPGHAIASFMAGANVCRRDAFLAAGGYHERYLIGAEESLLSLDLLQAGYELVYLDDVVLYHDPAEMARDRPERRCLVMRNRLWTAWLRLPWSDVLRATLRAMRRSLRDPLARRSLREAFCGLPWVLRERRCVSPEVSRTREALIETAA